MVTGSVVLAGIVLHGRRITKLVLRFVHRKDFDELASLAASFVAFLLPVSFLATIGTGVCGDTLSILVRDWPPGGSIGWRDADTLASSTRRRSGQSSTPTFSGISAAAATATSRFLNIHSLRCPFGARRWLLLNLENCWGFFGIPFFGSLAPF